MKIWQHQKISHICVCFVKLFIWNKQKKSEKIKIFCFNIFRMKHFVFSFQNVFSFETSLHFLIKGKEKKLEIKMKCSVLAEHFI